MRDKRCRKCGNRNCEKRRKKYVRAKKVCTKCLRAKEAEIGSLRADNITGKLFNGNPLPTTPFVVQGYHEIPPVEGQVQNRSVLLNNEIPFPPDGVFTHEVPVAGSDNLNIDIDVAAFANHQLVLKDLPSWNVSINYTPTLISTLPEGKVINVNCEMFLKLDYDIDTGSLYAGIYNPGSPPSCQLGDGLCGRVIGTYSFSATIKATDQTPELVEGVPTPVYTNDVQFGGCPCDPDLTTGNLLLPKWFNEERNAFQCNDRPFTPYKNGIFVDGLYYNNAENTPEKAVSFSQYLKVPASSPIQNQGTVKPLFNGNIHMCPLFKGFHYSKFNRTGSFEGPWLTDLAYTIIGYPFPNRPNPTVPILYAPAPNKPQGNENIYINPLTVPDGYELVRLGAFVDELGPLTSRSSATIKSVVMRMVLENPEDAQYLKIVDTDPEDPDHHITVNIVRGVDTSRLPPPPGNQ